MAELLSTEARKSALKGLPGWTEGTRAGGNHTNIHLPRLQRGVRVHGPRALVAEKNDHHPEWRNVYKTVEVVLATHDAGGVTVLDIELAKAMNAIAAQLGVG